MIEWFKRFVEANLFLAYVLYWGPLMFCAVGFAVRTYRGLRADLKERSSRKDYHPSQTVGSLVGRVVCTIVPVVNIFAVFDLLGPTIEVIHEVFDQPLIPKRRG